MAIEKNLGIAICPDVVSKEHVQRYTNLFHHTVNKAMTCKHGQETVLNATEAIRMLLLCPFVKRNSKLLLFNPLSSAQLLKQALLQ
jgi:hypothetical protein